MVFHSYAKRKLLALISPWLAHPPQQVHLKLGLIRSHLTLKTLKLNPSALNTHPASSAGFRFDQVTVEEIVIEFSTWDAIALSVEINGVCCKVSVMERRGMSDTSVEDMKRKKTISKIDPEGSTIHEFLEKISVASTSRNLLTNSFWSLVLGHCYLRVQNINFQVQFPLVDDSVAIIAELKEFNAESQFIENESLLRRLGGALFTPVKVSSFTVDASGFQIILKTKDDVNYLCSSSNLSMSVKCNDLHLEDLRVCIPELYFSLSMVDLPVIVAFGTILSRDPSHARNGRELWKLAASRIRHVVSSPQLSLHNMVNVVMLWLRYVAAYEYLLSLVGYSLNFSPESSLAKISVDKMISGHVKQHFKLLSDIENALPAELVARGRQVGRYRVAILQCTVDSRTSYKFFNMVIHYLAYIWNFIYLIFHLVKPLLFLENLRVEEPEIDADSSSLPQDPCFLCCFILNLRKVVITISHVNTFQPSIVDRLKSQVGDSFLTFASFALSVDDLLVMYDKKICEQSNLICCGQLRVDGFPRMESSILKEATSKCLFSGKGYERGSHNDMKPIIWFEPIESYLLLESRKTKSQMSSYDPFMEKLMMDTMVSWKKVCMDIEESENESPGIPCLLSDIKSFLTSPGLKSPDNGFSKFCLIVGKLNFSLTFSTIVSLSLLLKQVDHALSITKEIKTTAVRSQSQGYLVDQPEDTCNDLYKSIANEIKLVLLGLLPERHVQIVLLLAGPHILLSLREGCDDGNLHMEHGVGQDNFQLAFDFQNMEIAVWPTLKSDFVSLSDIPGFDNLEPDSPRMRELKKVDIPEAVCGNYISQGEILLSCYLNIHGLCAYLGDSTENWTQILSLKPIFSLFSSSRKYVHSFSTSNFALSAAFDGLAAGLTVSYTEELMVFLQGLGSLYSQISYSLNKIDFVNISPHREYMMQEVVSAFNVETTAGGYPSDNYTTLMAIDGNFKLTSVELVLHSLRLANDTGDCMRTVDSITGKRSAEDGLPDCGLLISVQGMCLETSFESGSCKVLLDMSELKSAIFKYFDMLGENVNRSVNQNLYLETLDCLYEISIPSCNFALWLGLTQSSSSVVNKYNMGSESIFGPKSSLLTGSTLATDIESSNVGISKIRMPALGQLVINVRLGGMYIGSCAAKKTVLGAHQLNELISSLHVGGDFQIISFATKGRVMFLDLATLSIFVQYVSSYRDCNIGIWSNGHQIEGHHREDTAELNGSDQHSRETISSFQLWWELIEAFTLDMSELSFVLLVEEESGGIRELLLELELHSELKSANTGNTFKLDLTHLSVLSQFLSAGIRNESNTPHFASSTSETLVGDYSVSNQHGDEICSISGENCARRPILGRQYNVDADLPEVLHIIHENYILKHLTCSVHATPEESTLCSSHAWVGSGSLKGFDITITVSEIQMVLSVFASLSGMNNKAEPCGLISSHLPNIKRKMCDPEAVIPDGSIVAIQDAHQHMYISVEEGESRYGLSGANHYSLVGERALFRVKYHKPRIWKSPVLWFSLVSLHAKNESGESLRLNYRSGSGFVDISGTRDSGSALWRAIPFKSESIESDIDWEPYNQSFKNMVHLVNRKNGCAVAFINKVPEFVKKPGHPFKLKVFYDHPLMLDGGIREHESIGALKKDLKANLSAHEGRTTEKSGKVPWVYFTIEKVSLTVVHELPDTRDMVPLLQFSLSDIQCPLQLLSTKTKIICTTRVELLYFEAQTNIWRELIHPVEICVFYRFRSQIQTDQTDYSTFSSYFHCRTTEFNVYMSQLSLDILLFIVGELNMAGPYSVRSSVILANCCKVENRAGLNVLCQFQKNQSVRIAREQSCSIFLGQSRRANQPPGSMPVVSIRLSALGSFTTSSIDLPLLESRVFAWRTRIMSLQDSRTFPGPFVVIDISNKSEDGLAIVVSPLIKIHNETKFPVEIRFQRPQQLEDEVASVLLKPGDMIDDSMATFDAINSSGGLKKALLSLSVGNFIFSFRPEVADSSEYRDNSDLVEWSDDLKGGKAVRLSGIFNKLSYKLRKALSGDTVKCSFSTASCILKSNDASIANMHFLIQSIERDIPIICPDKSSGGFGDKNMPVAVQRQKEISLLPTVRVSNLLHTDVDVLLTETELCNAVGLGLIGKKATISSGSTVDFYANPAMIYFNITILAFNLSCKPVDSGDWAKKMHKQKNDVSYLDLDLDFSSRKLFATLRLSRGHRGILEAVIFTAYALENDSEFSLIFGEHNKKSTFRDVDKSPSDVPPELGLLLPPKTTRSWFLKSKKLHLKLLGSNASGTFLDLDALSGITEIGLEMDGGHGVEHITNFGVSIGPCWSGAVVPSQIVKIVPRYVVYNESKETALVRQCYLEDDMESIIAVGSRQRKTLLLRNGIMQRREFSLFENIIRKHKSENDDLLKYIQFRLSDVKSGWSGPLCIASRGRFFLKFRKAQTNDDLALNEYMTEFAVVHMVEEGSTVVLHFHKPPNVQLPYRIENYLHESSITYYQKDSSEPEILGSGCIVDYVWDDLTHQHKLVVQINDMHLLREISLDKVRAWKPFSKVWQHHSIVSHLLLDKKSGDQRLKSGETFGVDPVKVGYEVYADGPTRVLRLCEYSDSHKEISVSDSCSKIRLRVPSVAFQLLESGKRDMDGIGQAVYTPVVVARVEIINLDAVLSVREIYSQLLVKSLNVEPKWVGSPFAAMLRRHQLGNSNTDDSMLKVALVLLSASSSVIQVKYSSIVLQPFDLKIDEETLMRVVPFWRSSLSNSSTPSRQFYFDHFEIHPIKIIASFLPGESYSSYSSAQETLRSLLHSIIKVPPIENMVVELNGVLVTHALVTTRELLIRCTQHYSWYAMRAISIAKGSSLLPPDFASVFDDIASSSLDVFFDPTHGLNIPGVTLGTFRFISKCIKGKGISGTRRYFGDLGKTLRAAGSNAMFAAVTEISDSVLKGAEASGFRGMVSGFHIGILRLAMEPSLLGTALMEGGPDRKIKLDQSPGVDELYIEGYLQAMLDTMYKQEYLRVRVVDDEVFLKNLPPNSSLIEEIMDRVKSFLLSKALLKGDLSTTSRPLRHLRGESEFRIGPTVLTLCEHLFVSFSIRILRKQTGKYLTSIKWKSKPEDTGSSVVVPSNSNENPQKVRFKWKWGIGKFIFSGLLAYIDGRLCRCIPNPIARRIVSGFLLSFIDNNDN